MSTANSTVTKMLRFEGTPALYWGGDDTKECRAQGGVAARKERLVAATTEAV
jgi:hypothetical protein